MIMDCYHAKVSVVMDGGLGRIGGESAAMEDVVSDTSFAIDGTDAADDGTGH
jgi:hypothetical protein